MNKTDHLLTILIEECSEVQKVACKALRFGLDDTNPATKNSNRAELAHEINDLLAIIREIGFIESLEDQAKKMAKVNYWLEYSKTRGRLEN